MLVSNTGQLTHLAQIGLFEALALLGTIYIPARVFDEVCISKSPGTRELKEAQYIKIISVNEEILSNVKKRNNIKLHEAEEHAITLCEQLNIALFLTDDMNARKVAKQLGFKVQQQGILLKDTGLTRKEASDLRVRLTTFESDWNMPGMEAYDEL
ncbi:MAG: hypothetical protein ABH870_02120 [bacterium]